MKNSIENKIYFKKYIEMNNMEKELALHFSNLKNKDIDSINKLDDILCGKIYDKGNGIIFAFNNKEIIAKIAVVLECIKPLGTSFIHNIEIKDELENRDDFLILLIKEAKELAVSYGAKSVKLGIRNNTILNTLKKVNLYRDYSAIKMKLNDKSVKEDVLVLEELTIENSQKYLEVFNDSFSDMPHGTWLDNEDLNRYLNNKEESKYYFMVKNDDNIIGFMNCEIEINEGMFDIGLCKSYRGKGLGKKLLETAIQFLNNKNVANIALIVIEKNNIAYEMYKKRGFIKENTISEWIEL
ncbi:MULTISPECIES: GNAT family N-acetyltransferase [unclassified Clostridium]|jgi:ribosomal protein S18 acetylase RimI-like enzyme|uniref:GNAT family N-acetyltransferase n=1 Tax=Clostridium TaxID=1485 RepID=UPI001C8C1780|nr:MULTISPECIES: GNAT family N-acetyltransferase [unclassified Clostridium]MBX9139134.1 GNAT family N-acetyltransferase [Clostridium sp. K12(2020)]MBX9145915.1 GNAT family N-acetyltransferase [Clostridium sp. K13]MDU2289979.1 GNAT family N-acetyltransferase [Clostridium celatum]MDU4324465.1 GNAT family N-acetyltransferase [Clostridium celatum]